MGPVVVMAWPRNRASGVDHSRSPSFGTGGVAGGVGGLEGAERVCAATRVWVHSTSLGGVESQLERRRRIPSEPVKVPENLIRLSVGIEDVEEKAKALGS